MNLFFASLPMLPIVLGHQNDQTNNPQPTIVKMMEPMMAMDMFSHHIRPCTLGTYLTQLHGIPTCFIPACLLPSGTRPQPGHTHAMIVCKCRSYQQQFMTIAHLDLPHTGSANVDLQPPLAPTFLCHLSQNLPHLAPLLHHTANPWFLIDCILPGPLN